MATNKPRTLEQFAEDEARARYAENSEIARSNRALRATVEAQKQELAEIRQRLGIYEMLDASPITPPAWVSPKGPTKRHAAIPALMLTDVHWDETIRPEQLDWMNAYNRTIAERRVRAAFEGAIHVSRDYLRGVEYEGFQLFLGGDLISGIIHEELRETNQGTVIESILSVVEPLVAGINLLAKDFKRVHVAAVVGNHGRRTQKPVAKNRPQDNFDWLVYKLLQRELKSRKDVTMQVADSADAHVPIYQTRYLLTHGDQFKGGSGIAAALSPLLLGVHRKTRRQAATSRPFDVMVMGHFHKSIWMPGDGLIVGGAVCGYNEYAYQANLAPEPPQCALWLTTPERGITASVPVFVADRATEGW